MTLFKQKLRKGLKVNFVKDLERGLWMEHFPRKIMVFKGTQGFIETLDAVVSLEYNRNSQVMPASEMCWPVCKVHFLFSLALSCSSNASL